MTYLLVFLWGMFVGKMLEGDRWARNSKDYRRIEFFGKIYKVSEDGR